MSVWKASRGFGGKSFMLAALALTEAMLLGAEVNVIGGSADQAEAVVRYTEEMVGAESFPAELLTPADAARRKWASRAQGEAGLTKARLRLSNGGKVNALAASTKAARGPHPTRLRIDEADEMSRLVFDASMGQTMAKGGVSAQTVVSSTHHYPDGMMADVLGRAEKQGWPVYTWCYRCTMQTAENPDGWLAPEEVERKRGEVTATMWDTEYDLQEPSTEGRAIDTEAVERAFDPALGEYEGENGEHIILEERRADADYVTGTDWGRKKDFTIISTCRVVSRDPIRLRLVEWQRLGRGPWPWMIGQHNARIAKYGGIALHDATGLGDVVEGYVDPALADVAGGVVLVGQLRSSIFSSYVVAIEAGRLEHPRIQWAYKEHKYVTVDDLYRAGRAFHPPDSFVAGALSYLAARIGAGEKWEVYDDV